MVELGYGIGKIVLDFVRGEEDATEAVDGGCIWQFDTIFLEGLPNLVGGELLAFRGVEDAANGYACLKELVGEGGAGEIGIVDEGFAIEDEAVAIDAGGAGRVDFYADTGERASLGELNLVESFGDEGDFLRGSQLEGYGEIDGGRARVVLDRGDKSVVANPEGFVVHMLGVGVLGILEIYKRRQFARTGKHCPDYPLQMFGLNQLMPSLL